MDFKLGDLVQHRFTEDVATVVAIDTRDPFAVMLGWKKDQIPYESAYRSSTTTMLSTDRALPNWREDYPRVFWEAITTLTPVNPKLFSKVRLKTLRKRMRDQLAQEALSIKE